MLAPAFALALALAAPVAASAEAARAAQAHRPPTVTVVAAVRGEIAETVAVTGSLAPREEVLVGVDVEGARLLELFADEGDRVAQGQLLARLDPAAFEIELAQNLAQRARAEAAAAQAESLIAEMTASKAEADAALRRVETLKARGVAAADALDERTAAASVMAAKLFSAERGLDLARAERASLEAARREIELRLSRTEIVAPRGGVVLARAARIGMVASMQAGPLFRIAADGLVELDAEVTETDLARVRAGQSATVSAAGAPPVAGAVRLVSPSVDPTTRLGHVRVALPADPALRDGVFARGLIEIDRREGVLIPASALGGGGGRAAVQVVRDGRVETRAVEIGLRDGGTVEIRAGLEAGETVVLKAGAFLGDGDAVTAAPAEALP
jgi:multidrug efflux pump subunit AcrA (membrane-fusion protein)